MSNLSESSRKGIWNTASNDLPKFRDTCKYAFENVGLDFADPFIQRTFIH